MLKQPLLNTSFSDFTQAWGKGNTRPDITEFVLSCYLVQCELMLHIYRTTMLVSVAAPDSVTAVWNLTDPSWKQPIWIVSSQSEHDRTDQHAFKEKDLVAPGGVSCDQTGRLSIKGAALFATCPLVQKSADWSVLNVMDRMMTIILSRLFWQGLFARIVDGLCPRWTGETI